MSIFSSRYRALVRQIVVARKRACLTQLEIAKRLEKPQSYVSKSETGERRLDFVELVDLIEALGLSPLDFIQETLSNSSFRISSRWHDRLCDK